MISTGVLKVSWIILGILWLSKEFVKALKYGLSLSHAKTLYRGCLIHSFTPFLSAIGLLSRIGFGSRKLYVHVVDWILHIFLCLLVYILVIGRFTLRFSVLLAVSDSSLIPISIVSFSWIPFSNGVGLQYQLYSKNSLVQVKYCLSRGHLDNMHVL